MTPTTDEGRKLAAELANAAGSVGEFDQCNVTHSPLGLALARLATDHLALKAEHENAVADLREIDRLASQEPCNWIRERKHDRTHLVAAIAAKYRETDPLYDALHAVVELGRYDTREQTQLLRAELSKRGFEIARVKP